MLFRGRVLQPAFAARELRGERSVRFGERFAALWSVSLMQPLFDSAYMVLSPSLPIKDFINVHLKARAPEALLPITPEHRSARCHQG